MEDTERQYLTYVVLYVLSYYLLISILH